jgi:RNA polymerase sigma factor (sigma-70 family)
LKVSRSDAQLLAEIESLYREQFSDFVAVAASIVADRETAREAVQEAFASVVRGRRQFRGEGRLEAWVWRVVINAARKRKKRQAQHDVIVRDAEASTNGALPNEAEELDIATLVAVLPERQRLVLFLRYYADLDYRSIAQVLNVKTGTVSASIHAAHANLRRILKEVPR